MLRHLNRHSTPTLRWASSSSPGCPRRVPPPEPDPPGGPGSDRGAGHEAIAPTLLLSGPQIGRVYLRQAIPYPTTPQSSLYPNAEVGFLLEPGLPSARSSSPARPSGRAGVGPGTRRLRRHWSHQVHRLAMSTSGMLFPILRHLNRHSTPTLRWASSSSRPAQEPRPEPAPDLRPGRGQGDGWQGAEDWPKV